MLINPLSDNIYNDTKCDSKDNTKEQFSCISTVVLSKIEWFGKKNRKKHERYYWDFCCLLACSSEMRNLK